jgi:hypothetical protein
MIKTLVWRINHIDIRGDGCVTTSRGQHLKRFFRVVGQPSPCVGSIHKVRGILACQVACACVLRKGDKRVVILIDISVGIYGADRYGERIPKAYRCRCADEL